MKRITIDTETHLIEPGLLAPPMVSLGIKRDDEKVEMLHAKDSVTPEKVDAIFENGALLIGQNLPYDLAVLAAYCKKNLIPTIFKKYRNNETWDTSIADQMAHIAAGWTKGRPDGEYPKYNLAAIARRTLGVKVEGKEGEDIWRLRYSELDDIPIQDWPKEAYDYAYNDVEYTAQIADKQLRHRSNLATIDIQLRAAWALHLMSCWGLRVDPKALRTLKEQLRLEIVEASHRLKAVGIYRENGKKNMAVVKDLVEEAYEKLGKRCPTTPHGEPSTSKKVLEESGDPTLKILADISSTQKLFTTFIPVLELGLKGSVHPGYRTLVDTGRCSSFKPNIQQLPRKGGIRECFIPRDGYVYIAADYGVAELCSLAQILLKLFGTSKMADALRAGKDLHINTAASILGITYEDALRRYEEGDPVASETRQISKVLNFGLPGGLGSKAFVGYAAGFGLTVSYGESAKLVELWKNEYPEMQLYFNWINSQMGMGHGFTSIHSITGFIRGNVGYCDGANHQFQHLTATGAKIALFDVAEECYVDMGTALYGCRPVAFIHDEILMEAPEGVAHEAAMRLTEVMEASMSQVLTDISCKAEATMMRRWYKSAKPTWENGKLVPWEPES